MMAIKNRLEKLERAAANATGNFKPAFIAYTEGEKTTTEAAAEWEAGNGALSECSVVFFNVYEASARALWAT